MSRVEISQKSLAEAQASLKNLYVLKFGEDSLSVQNATYTREELILKYGKNLRFWSDQLPEVTTTISQFCMAKHAICTNALEQLWKKVDEYDIRSEVDVVANAVAE